MTSVESSAARPTMTMASQPQRLPAIANPLLASESLMRFVSGLLLTTANLAEVVSGLPTSGLKTKASGASGESASDAGCALLEQEPRAQAAAAEKLPQHGFGNRHAIDAAVRDIDAEVAAVIAERRRRHVSRPHRQRESARSRWPRGGCVDR